MVSHVTVVPASTRAGVETIRHLLATRQELLVRGIYRDTAKAPAEFTQNTNFEAVKGNVTTDADLDFSKSDAVLYVPPPTYDGSDQMEFSKQGAQNVAAALKKANVKKLVLHSAMGTHLDHGIGILDLNRITDEILKNVVPEVVIVRPGWFFEMWVPALQSMRREGSFESTFSPEDYKFPQVSARDVGEFCAQALVTETNKTSPHYVDLVGPSDYSSLDVKHAIEEAIGREGSLITIPRENLAEFFAKEMPERYVPQYVEMVNSMLAGGAIAEKPYGAELVRGKTKLVDAMKAFAKQ